MNVHLPRKRWRSKLLFNLFDRLVIVQHQITQVIKNFRCLLIMLVLITESIYRWLYCIPNIMLYESCMLIMVRKSRERVGKIVLIHPYNSNQQYGILKWIKCIKLGPCFTLPILSFHSMTVVEILCIRTWNNKRWLNNQFTNYIFFIVQSFNISPILQ